MRCIEIPTRVLADSRPERLAKTVPQSERERLAMRMLAPHAGLDAAIDDLLERLQAAIRGRARPARVSSSPWTWIGR